MRIEFDQLADALYVHLAEGEVEKTEEIKPGMILDGLNPFNPDNPLAKFCHVRYDRKACNFNVGAR